MPSITVSIVANKKEFYDYTESLNIKKIIWDVTANELTSYNTFRQIHWPPPSCPLTSLCDLKGCQGKGQGSPVFTLWLAQHVLDLINVISEIDLPAFYIEYKGTLEGIYHFTT